METILITVDAKQNSNETEDRIKRIINAVAGETVRVEFYLGKQIVRRGPSQADVVVRVIRPRRM